jgi:ankyrin repeat protein
MLLKCRLVTMNLRQILLFILLLPTSVFAAEKLNEKFFDAIFFGDHRKVSKFLKEGVDPNIKDPGGRSALIRASSNGNLRIVKILVEAGADLHARDGWGHTALMAASGSKHKKVVRYLLEKDAHRSELNCKGKTTSVIKAADSGAIDILELLVTDMKEVLDHTDEDQQTAIMQAARKGDYKTFMYLLKKGASLSGKDKEGKNILHLAAWGANKKIMEELLKRGFDIHEKDDRGRTPLHVTTFWGKKNASLFLLEKGADPNIGDKEGKTPFTSALYDQNLTVVKKMLPLMNKENLHKSMIAIAGSRTKSNKAMKYLLDHVDLDKVGTQALMKAASWGTVGNIKLLKSKGVSLTTQDSEGQTPLIHSIQGRNRGVIPYLIEGSDVNHQDQKGKTALFYAIENRDEEAIKLLLEKCAHIHIRSDVRGQTPYTLAKTFYGTDEIRAMLDAREKDPKCEKENPGVTANDTPIPSRVTASLPPVTIFDEKSDYIISPDGKFLALVNAQGKLEVRNLETGKVYTHELPVEGVIKKGKKKFDLKFSGDSSRVMAVPNFEGHEKELYFLDTDGTKGNFQYKYPIKSAGMDPNDPDRLLITTKENVVFYQIDESGEKELKTFGRANRAWFTHDGKRIVLEKGSSTYPAVEVVDSEGKNFHVKKREGEKAYVYMDRGMTRLEVSPDGKRLYAMNYGTMVEMNLQTGWSRSTFSDERVSDLFHDKQSSSSFLISSISAGFSGTEYRLEHRGGNGAPKFHFFKERFSEGVAFPGGEKVLLLKQGKGSIYNLNSKKMIEIPMDAIPKPVIDSDGKIYAVNDGKLNIYDDQGRVVKKDVMDMVHRLHVTPNGKVSVIRKGRYQKGSDTGYHHELHQP